MEARPWYKKVTQYFRRGNQTLPTITVHEYPLRDDPKPAKVVTVRRAKRKFVIQPVSTDPRFNHALRRAKRIDIDTEGAV